MKAIKRYLREKAKHNLDLAHKPFFMTRDAKGYTGREFNNTLSSLTSDLTKNTNAVVKSTSLRAGVPSELAKRGADPSQIHGVGRWSSEAWKDYCKLGRKKRMIITDNLYSTI